MNMIEEEKESVRESGKERIWEKGSGREKRGEKENLSYTQIFLSYSVQFDYDTLFYIRLYNIALCSTLLSTLFYIILFISPSLQSPFPSVESVPYMVAVTQPRRVAAITVAQRVAAERNGNVMLCYDMLCYVMLCNVMICYVMLSYDML